MCSRIITANELFGLGRAKGILFLSLEWSLQTTRLEWILYIYQGESMTPNSFWSLERNAQQNICCPHIFHFCSKIHLFLWWQDSGIQDGSVSTGTAERHIDSAFNLVSAQLSSKAGVDEKACLPFPSRWEFLMPEPLLLLSLLSAWLCMTISLWFSGPVMNSAVLSLGREEANVSDGQRAARAVPDPISGRLLVPSSFLGPFRLQ